MQGQQVGGLRAQSILPGFAIEVFPVYGSAYIVGKLGIFRRLCGLFKQARHAGKQARVFIEENGGHKFSGRNGGKGAVGLSAAYAAVHGAGPIAVIIILHYAEAGAGHKILLPRLQLLIVFPYHGRIAEKHIAVPWHKQEYAGERIGLVGAEYAGRNILYGAVRILRVGKILHPFAQKRAAGEVVYYFLYAHGAVVHPALALVALGAVRRHGVKIAFLRPQHALLYAVQKLVGAGEAAAYLYIGAHLTPGELYLLRGAALQLNIAEAVIGEGGLPACLAAAADVYIVIFCPAQVFLVYRAVLIEHFGKAQGYRAAAGKLGFDFYPACKVLTEIVYIYSRRGRAYAYRLHILCYPYGLGKLRLHGIAGRGNRYHGAAS